MSFQTFSGTSRRPRKVNLSGSSADPFALSSGVSKTVSNAQAERLQRLQERQRIQAAKTVQRVWRGHKQRSSLAEERRSQLGLLYEPTQPTAQTPQTRMLIALPLLLSSFALNNPTSHTLLDLFIQDLTYTGAQPFLDSHIHTSRLRELVRLLLSALETAPNTPKLIQGLTIMVEACPSIVASFPTRYFGLLAKLASSAESMRNCQTVLLHAVGAPLALQPLDPADTAVSSIYEGFAFSFLSSADLLMVEEDPTMLSPVFDLDVLSKTINTGLSRLLDRKQGPKDILWLLSHFIALGRASPSASSRYQYLEALCNMLRLLAGEIQGLMSAVGRRSNKAASSLPTYIETQLRSLVDRQEISQLLQRLTSDYASSVDSREYDNASLLAGFTLTLLRAFPSSGDDIRMRLFLGDAMEESGPIPSIQFFWKAVKKTVVYKDILSGKQSPVALIRPDRARSGSVTSVNTLQHEWKTILLLLELYVFLLRLTDDDDFFGVMGPNVSSDFQHSSRVRLCNFSPRDVKNLTVFLKNLAFSLYYDAPEILRSRGRSRSSSTWLAVYLETGSSEMHQKDTSSDDAHAAAIASTLGVGFNAFRDTVITTLRMLYERDSRRPFLPADHWLMTSRFDMEGFISAVVTEEHRQQELRATGQDAEADEGSDSEDGGLFFSSPSRPSRLARIERIREQHRKTQRERMLAVVGPKLEILHNMPFVIPFETRVQIFRRFVFLDKERRLNSPTTNPDSWRAGVVNDPAAGPRRRHNGQIRRGHLFDDALDQFYQLGEGLKEPLAINFVDKFGGIEAGIDGGGVTKEFLTSVTREAFGATGGTRLFKANPQNLLYPSPTSFDALTQFLTEVGYTPESPEWREQLTDLGRRYEFLGRVVGKCMYEGILIDVSFAGFFLLKWASSAQAGMGGENSYRANLNDLRELDHELYQGMLRLKNYKGDVAVLEQDFTILDEVSIQGEPVKTVMRELIPRGQDTLVTNENRPLYISYVARHRLVVQPLKQTKAFLRGLGCIIDLSWLSMFNQNELQRLVGGDSSVIDIEDLRSNTVYSGVYAIGDDGLEHPTIQIFWEVLHEMDDAERRDVLKYVTSTPRAPLLGFQQLNPKFSIRDSSQDQERLPSTSTCINLLKLPQYRTKEVLKTKLLYAVQSGAGFDLS